MPGISLRVTGSTNGLERRGAPQEGGGARCNRSLERRIGGASRECQGGGPVLHCGRPTGHLARAGIRVSFGATWPRFAEEDSMSTASPPLPAAFALSLALVLAVAVLPGAAFAQDSAPEKVRADFPDRRWTPVGAADAGLAGAGLATDPASSAYGNPALWLTAPWTFRISGGLMNPNRDDLRTSTVEFDDANGFPLLSEAAVRFQWRGLGVGGYFAQPHYEHGETRFIGFNPANPGGGGDPYPRINTFTSATRLAGVGAAIRLQGGVIVGAGAEAVLAKESYRSQPDIAPGSFVA